MCAFVMIVCRRVRMGKSIIAICLRGICAISGAHPRTLGEDADATMAGSQLGEDDLALWTSLGVDAAACRCSDLVVYIVLGMLYESFIYPITILSALPSSSAACYSC